MATEERDQAVFAAVREDGAKTFGSPTRVDTGGMSQLERVDLAVAPTGGAVAVWEGSDGSTADYEQRYVLGGAVARDGEWRPGQQRRHGHIWPGVVPAIGPDGEAFVLASADPTRDPATGALAHAPAGGDLAPFAALPSAVPAGQPMGRKGPELLDAAVDAGGRLVTAWLWHAEDGAGWAWRVVTKVRLAHGTWCGTSPFDGPSTSVRLGFDALGGGVAAWSGNLNIGHIGYANYTPSGGCPPVPDVWPKPPTLHVFPPGHEPPNYLPVDPPNGAPPPPGPRPPDDEPAPSPIRLATRTLHQGPSGLRTSVLLRCTAARPCRGWLSVRSRAARVGRAARAAAARRVRFTIRPGATRAVRAPLDRRALRALRRRGRAHVIVETRLVGSPGLIRTPAVVVRRAR
jgi:hypothetical protein